MQHRLEPRKERARAARDVEIFHQPCARGPQVGDHRHARGEIVEVLERDGHAGPTRHGDEVHHGIGGAGERAVHDQGILDRFAGDDVGRLEILPDHLDDAASGGGRHARMRRVHRGNGCGTGQGQSQHLGDGSHGGGGAHGHAGAGRARDACLHVVPLLSGDVAGLLFGPVFPHVGARAENLAAKVAAHHRPRGHKIDGQIHADPTHDRSRRGLVAAAHQHCAIHRVLPQKLLGLHGEEVAVEHGGRFDELLR